jgi:hypothetical protein
LWVYPQLAGAIRRICRPKFAEDLGAPEVTSHKEIYSAYSTGLLASDFLNGSLVTNEINTMNDQIKLAQIQFHFLFYLSDLVVCVRKLMST